VKVSNQRVILFNTQKPANSKAVLISKVNKLIFESSFFSKDFISFNTPQSISIKIAGKG
jgi:hypothetical protein